jgi:hypothetical protein
MAPTNPPPAITTFGDDFVILKDWKYIWITKITFSVSNNRNDSENKRDWKQRDCNGWKGLFSIFAHLSSIFLSPVIEICAKCNEPFIVRQFTLDMKENKETKIYVWPHGVLLWKGNVW